MRFGLVGFPLGQMKTRVEASPGETVTTIARAAEDLGFAFVAAQDHVLAPREWSEWAGETWFDPFVVLSWAAAVTRRVGLLTDIVVLPYRSPFVMAKTAGSLDAISEGRVILGVAAGYLEQEFGILGASFPDRGARTDEAIEVIKRCWTDDWLDYSGEFFSAREVTISPRPARQPRPPIWVGGNSMRALRRAVEHADGWTPFRVEPDDVRRALGRARALGLEEGRRFDVAVPLRRGMYRGEHELDVETILRRAEEFSAAGVTYLKVGFRGSTLDDHLKAMETFSGEVIARFA